MSEIPSETAPAPVPASVPPPGPVSPPARMRLLERVLLVLALGMPIASACSPRDLWAPDEPRYGQVAREVLRDGSWLALRQNGEPYAEKPPVYYWLAALLSWPAGDVTPVTARLAGALLAAAAVALVFALVRRWFRDPALATTAALLFAGTGLILWNAPRAGLDLPLTCCVLATVLALDRFWERGGNGWAALAGVLWALGILVKGPMGFFVPPLVLAGGALAARRRPARLFPGVLVALGVMAAVCLAWLVPAILDGGEAYRDRLLGQIADRATGEEGSHVRPWHYYLVRVGPFVMPFAFVLLAGLLALFRRPRPEGDRFGLGAAGMGTLGLLALLSWIATKREVYLVPLVPFAALLGAYALHRGLFPRLLAFGRDVALLVAAGAGVAALVAPFLVRALWRDGSLPDLDPLTGRAMLSMGVLFVVFVGGAWLAWRRRADVLACVRGTAATVLVGATLYHVLFLPFLDPLKSFRRAAEAAEQFAEGGPIYHAGVGQTGSVLWPLARERTASLWTPEELARVLAPDAPRAAVIAEAGHWERTVEAARQAGGDLAFLARVPVVWKDRVGHRRIEVLTNAPPLPPGTAPTGPMTPDR